MEQANQDYERVAAAIEHLEANRFEQPSLEELADFMELSPAHAQKLFQRWVGVSPKRFLQGLTLEHARDLLGKSRSVLDTSLEVGLSGPSRLHDLFVSIEAMTPGEYARAGRGVEVRWGSSPGPFGQSVIGWTERGVCALSFLSSEDEPLEIITRDWGEATLIEDQDAASAWSERIFSPIEEQPDEPLSMVVKGTNFQLKVWEALLRIPAGQVASYDQVANSIGKPKASRAVGQAIGRNSIAYLIPCHRVLRKDASLSGYRWGGSRKRAILAHEFARANS